MKFLQKVWKWVSEFLDSLDAYCAPASAQLGSVPDELDSFEGWK